MIGQVDVFFFFFLFFHYIDNATLRIFHLVYSTANSSQTDFLRVSFICRQAWSLSISKRFGSINFSQLCTGVSGVFFLFFILFLFSTNPHMSVYFRSLSFSLFFTSLIMCILLLLLFTPRRYHFSSLGQHQIKI